MIEFRYLFMEYYDIQCKRNVLFSSKNCLENDTSVLSTRAVFYERKGKFNKSMTTISLTAVH